MASNSLLFLKDFGYVKLLMDKKGQTWLFWSLTQRQQRFLGIEISPISCFRIADLCDRHLKRPHLTCFTCKLRLVVSGKLPFYYPIRVSQIWSRKGKSSFRNLLFKEALSLAEMLS